MVELLTQNLTIEPDLQTFLGFVLQSARALGANAFAATLPTLDAARRLRMARSQLHQPLPVRLTLDGDRLRVEWQDQATEIVRLRPPPMAPLVDELRQRLLHSTEDVDPSLLQRRNAEMTRYLEETRARTEAELEALQQILEKRQMELRESLRRAETDALTGLLNRRAYDDRVACAFNRTLRQKDESLCLALFDLDHFKAVNDEFGHQAGDAYLRKMADAMRSVIRREVDYAFRFGGDEFAMLIFAGADIAVEKAKEVLAAMDGRVSIGLASLSGREPADSSLQAFIRRADEALYQAKGTGRGRIVLAVRDPKGAVHSETFLSSGLEDVAA
ncbi:MAG: GGDEF domain-containing protein [Betaproteobacteria bacterium]|nr:GGDEF domain-containing protein [Betaproteobacteria bacterium]